MRPNVDEYDDIEDETSVGDAGGSRAVSWVVLAVAVGGFASLAYYAYHSGAKSMAESTNAPVIEADAGPIKEAPANPEGEQFANKDKTIYDVIANDGKGEPEKLMPDPERPVVAADVEDSEDSQPAIEPVARPAPVAAAAPTPVPAPVLMAPPTPAPSPVTEEQPVQATVVASAPQAAAQAPAAAPAATPAGKMETAALDPKKTEVKSYAAPEMVNETTVAGKPEASKAEGKAESKKKPEEAAKPKSKPAGGGAKVQLGAYGSEAEAQGAWKKLSAKYSSVLTGSPVIVKADVNGKTYYRLRSNVADAKAACAKVQPCMAVK